MNVVKARGLTISSETSSLVERYKEYLIQVFAG